jgi:hypothetical protein
MSKFESISRCQAPVVLSSILIFLSTPSNAYAYIDPGAGSYVFQILIAGLLAALFFLKAFWQRVKAFFTKESPQDWQSTPEARANDPDDASVSRSQETQGSSNESDRNDT